MSEAEKKSPINMALINSFQLVASFAAFPFLIGWLGSGPFTYSGVLAAVSIVAYAAVFVRVTGAVYTSLRE